MDPDRFNKALCSYLLTCWQKKKKKSPTESRILTQILADGAWRWHTRCSSIRSSSVVQEQLFHFKVILSSVKGSYLVKTIIKVRWWKMAAVICRYSLALPGREDGAEWLQLAAAADAVIMWNGNICCLGTGRSTNNLSRHLTCNQSCTCFN